MEPLKQKRGQLMNWKGELLKARRKWYLANYAACRDFGVPIAKPYGDNSTNRLTKAVYDWLKFHDHYVNRINSRGQARIEKVKCVGKTITHVRWAHGTSNKGTPGIDCIINGVPVKIEIKCKVTHDKMSTDQYKE